MAHNPADKKRTIELLAPGGDAYAVKAAIIAGADAVYCGLPRFNARQRADNITREQLRDLILIAHQNNCRIYLTLNTLVTADELQDVANMLTEVQQMGVDAIIVQDPGVLWLIKNHFPGLEVHASTQMTTHCSGQLAFLEKLGITQVNLSRELSMKEILPLCRDAHSRKMACELFVHGAWCISFSGQCYMSSVMAGKSGNRGACVQPCRREYRGAKGERITSPFNLKDNSAYALTEQLGDAGADSFKIEGRIKNYKYVFTTVTAWRKQLDRYLEGAQPEADDPALRTVFNRSLSSGYLEGKIKSSMFIDSSRDQSLVPVCEVRSFTADTGTLKLEKEAILDPEIPVLIYGSGFTFICTGLPVERIGRFEYRFKITHKLKGKIKNGDMVYRQADCVVPEDLKQRIDALKVQKVPLSVKVTGTLGKPLFATFSTGSEIVECSTETPLSEARKQALSEATIRDKLSMLGDTMFELTSLDASGVSEKLFLPLRELNELRRNAIRKLMSRIGHNQEMAASPTVPRILGEKDEKAPNLALLINDPEDLQLSTRQATRVCFELPVDMGMHLQEYVDLFRSNPRLIPWFPAILIDGHFAGAVTLLTRIQPDYIITDNSGIGMEATKYGISWIAGPLLNVTNSYSGVALKEAGGASGVFVSHELSRDQMAGVTTPGDFSRWYTLYAPLLMMNTRQCILRNVTGCTKELFDEGCLATCRKVHSLADRKKNRFFLVKRHGFYNQVYNGRNYFNPAVAADMPRHGALFLCDMRRVVTETRLSVSRNEFVSTLEAFIEGKIEHHSSLRKLVRETTSAQYTRGI